MMMRWPHVHETVYCTEWLLLMQTCADMSLAWFDVGIFSAVAQDNSCSRARCHPRRRRMAWPDRCSDSGEAAMT